MSAYYKLRMKADKQSGELFLYGDIGFGSISADMVAKDLQALGKIQSLDIRINSGGGDVFDGTAIYNLLRRHQAYKTVTIDGAALSIASLIAMAGDKRIMAENAMFMVHNPWSIVMGTSEDMRKQADVMDQVRESLVATYEGRVVQSLGAAPKGQSRGEQIRKMMDAETWMRGPAALEAGFIDEVTEDMAIAASVNPAKFKNIPADFRAQLKDMQDSTPVLDMAHARVREMTKRAQRMTA